VSAFNIAEAGKEHALAKFRSGLVVPVAGSGHILFSNQPFDHGSYTVTYAANAARDTIRIRSTGTIGTHTSIIDVTCKISFMRTPIDPQIDAAVTALSEVTVTGNISIDGRDWNPTGDTLIDSTGVWGVKSSHGVNVDGSSRIGGKGFAPTKAVTSDIVKENAPAAGYPTNPEEALGLPAGMLDPYKTTSLPSFPFHGIVYYTPTGSFNCPKFKGSTGIFICHNASRTATMKNIDGDFTGLIISDRIDHVNANASIIGAVRTLSPSAGTNAFGNGNATIKYSSRVIADLINSFSFVTDTTYEVVSWKQTK
jgi:hypothetical protein